MWTSTKGIEVASKASRIATLVCVYAAGLMMAAIRPFLVVVVVVELGVKCECRKSMMAPSWFDWKGTMVMLSLLLCSTSDDVSCGSVVLP